MTIVYGDLRQKNSPAIKSDLPSGYAAIKAAPRKSLQKFIPATPIGWHIFPLVSPKSRG